MTSLVRLLTALALTLSGFQISAGAVVRGAARGSAPALTHDAAHPAQPAELRASSSSVPGAAVRHSSSGCAAVPVTATFARPASAASAQQIGSRASVAIGVRLSPQRRGPPLRLL